MAPRKRGHIQIPRKCGVKLKDWAGRVESARRQAAIVEDGVGAGEESEQATAIAVRSGSINTGETATLKPSMKPCTVVPQARSIYILQSPLLYVRGWEEGGRRGGERQRRRRKPPTPWSEVVFPISLEDLG
jgi:hypothetical protein